MRFPGPSSLGLALPYGVGRAAVPMIPDPQRLPPTWLEPPLPGHSPPHNLDPSQLVAIPAVDPTHPDSLSNHARRFDQVQYVDTPSKNRRNHNQVCAEQSQRSNPRRSL
jgi:hypothetical protein